MREKKKYLEVVEFKLELFAVVVNFRCLLFHICDIMRCTLERRDVEGMAKQHSIENYMNFTSIDQLWMPPLDKPTIFFLFHSFPLALAAFAFRAEQSNQLRAALRPFTGLLNDACTYRDVNKRNNNDGSAERLRSTNKTPLGRGPVSGEE